MWSPGKDTAFCVCSAGSQWHFVVTQCLFGKTWGESVTFWKPSSSSLFTLICLHQAEETWEETSCKEDVTCQAWATSRKYFDSFLWLATIKEWRNYLNLWHTVHSTLTAECSQHSNTSNLSKSFKNMYFNDVRVIVSGRKELVSLIFISIMCIMYEVWFTNLSFLNFSEQSSTVGMYFILYVRDPTVIFNCIICFFSYRSTINHVMQETSARDKLSFGVR